MESSPAWQLQPQQPGIKCVDKITALGVIWLTATDHISYVLAAFSSLLHALRVLSSHGLPETFVKDVFQLATVLVCMVRIFYRS